MLITVFETLQLLMYPTEIKHICCKDLIDGVIKFNICGWGGGGSSPRILNIKFYSKYLKSNPFAVKKFLWPHNLQKLSAGRL